MTVTVTSLFLGLCSGPGIYWALGLCLLNPNNLGQGASLWFFQVCPPDRSLTSQVTSCSLRNNAPLVRKLTEKTCLVINNCVAFCLDGLQGGASSLLDSRQVSAYREHRSKEEPHYCQGHRGGSLRCSRLHKLPCSHPHYNPTQRVESCLLQSTLAIADLFCPSL